MTNLSDTANGADITASKQMLLLLHFVYAYVLSEGICKMSQVNS